jgi:hypothetical protein
MRYSESYAKSIRSFWWDGKENEYWATILQYLVALKKLLISVI